MIFIISNDILIYYIAAVSRAVKYGSIENIGWQMIKIPNENARQ
jgi:hypothetical protein